MSYAYRNRGLKTISALQETTAIEEVTHYSFGIDLVNIIKEEHPTMWDEYMVELITDNIKVAYQSELNLIDWFFENGTPDHLTKEEVINFLNYNFKYITIVRPTRNIWCLKSNVYSAITRCYIRH